jgi:6-phosphogluconolactonase
MQPAPVHASPSVHRLRDADEVARSAAATVAAAAREAVAERGAFMLALAGGDTPRRLYEKLAAEPGIDWSRVELFWGDERSVPPEHPESNFGMARATLLAPLGIEPSRVHRIEAERGDLTAVAREYEAELARVTGARRGGPPPRLDLVLLGIGADGHTASLFPYTASLSESRRWVVAADVPQLSIRRVTITFPLIERARAVLVLVSGASKADTLAEVLEGPWDPERLPAQRIRARAGRVDWFVDAAAASRLRAVERRAT